MQKDIYNVVIDDSVYLIAEYDDVTSCIYVGTINHKFRLHKPEIREKALKACHQNN